MAILYYHIDKYNTYSRSRLKKIYNFNCKGRLQKKKSVKRVTLCKKGGGLRKKSNFECVNKNDILIGGRGSKPMSFFQDVS